MEINKRIKLLVDKIKGIDIQRKELWNEQRQLSVELIELETIKFRYLWKGKWYYIDFKKDNLAIKWGLYEARAKTTFPEQFTGLKDKNGKEIFEGDIIKEIEKGEEDEFAVIEWKEGALVCEWFISDILPSYSHLGGEDFMKDLEVIGNIYENPELIEVNEVGGSK